MTELTCQQCRELAAELATDVITGHERTQALAHLDNCTSCRDTISALTVTTDRLIELLPEVQPPPGFQHRVMTALTPPPPRTRRWQIPAAALLTLALAVTGWILGHTNHGTTPTQTNTHTENDAQAGERTVLYAPLTTGHQTGEHQIGHAYLYPGNPPWIYLSLDTNNTTNDTIKCEITRQDGSTVPVGTFPLTHGHGAWGGPTPIDRDTLATAKLINSNGHTLAKAHFTSPPKNRSHSEHQRHGHS
jgi:hypothetical protein